MSYKLPITVNVEGTVPSGLLYRATLFCVFKCRDTGGEFLPFLLVSKGKRLLSRLLPLLKNDAALEMLRIVTSNLPTLMSRDTEEVGESFLSAAPKQLSVF